MSDRTFPYDAFVLTPSLRVKQIQVTRPSRFDPKSWHISAGGKSYSIHNLHNTAEEAVAAGRIKLADKEADLKKRKERLAKQRAGLDASAAKLK